MKIYLVDLYIWIYLYITIGECSEKKKILLSQVEGGNLGKGPNLS